MKILVVDDDALAVEMVSAILESCNYQPVVAENVVEAFEQLQHNPDVELIISDMNMPLISGLEFFQELKQQQNTRPFILLTGEEPTSLCAQEPELNGCLGKDFALVETLPALIADIFSTD